MVLTNDTKKFLNKVRREGEFVSRYDKEFYEGNTKLYDDTHSVIVYDYTDENNKSQRVVMFMEYGEYVDYYTTNIKIGE